MATKTQSKRKAAARSTLAGGSDFIEVAIMVRGSRDAVAKYIRDTAGSVERGCVGGMTGDQNSANGRWISVP